MKCLPLSVLVAAVLNLAILPTRIAHAEADAHAAQALAKRNDCFKCHAIDKTKKGPSFKKVAAKYKGKPEGPDHVIKNITTGPEITLADGTKDKHRIIDTQDAKEIRNLTDWILAQ